MRDDDGPFPEPLGRPKTRAECRDGPRPCGWVGCRYHLFLDVTRGGEIQADMSRPPWLMHDSCALDIAERHENGVPLRELARIFGMTKQAIQNTLARASDRFKKLTRRIMDADEDPSIQKSHAMVYRRGCESGLGYHHIMGAAEFIESVRMTEEEKVCLAKVLTARE